MPIYEYLCDSCGRRSEEIQRISDAPLTTCTKCGGKLAKQISAPAFHLKGSGWYATDYADKDKSSAKEGGSDKENSKSDDKKSDKGSSDSKSSSDSGKSSSKSDKPAKDKD